MDSKVLITLILHLLKLSVCEYITFENSKTDLESEIPNAIKQYVNHVVSELREQYEHRIDNLQSELRLQRDVYVQELNRDTSDAKDERIKNLQDKVIKQRMQIQKLQMKQHTDSYVIRQMKQRLSNLERNFEMVNTDKVEYIARKDQERSKTKQRLRRDTITRRLNLGTPKQEANDQRSMGETRVAFFAQMTSHSTNLVSHQNLVFDHVVSNIGNAFDKNSGTFTAPLSGTYVFSVTLSHYKNGALSPSGHGMVMVNEHVVAWLYMQEEQSSQTILVQLSAGDHVLVQNLLAGQGYYGDRYSTFTGFLLYADDDSKSQGGLTPVG